MTNLLEETLDILRKNGKEEDRVRWVGNRTTQATWAEFKTAADRTYDNGYGAAAVAIDLVVVGDGWWLERWEYDGAEAWSYHTCPRAPGKSAPLGRVIGTPDDNPYWPTLAELNGGGWQ